MNLLAIDPGTTESAYVIFDGRLPLRFGKVANWNLLKMISDDVDFLACRQAVIEMVGHYGTGMSVGKEIFETCVWIGRFKQAWYSTLGDDVNEIVDAEVVLRATVKTHICGTVKANDSNIRAALIDRYGGKENAVGNKKTPGPLWGVSKDVWSALAIAVTWFEMQKQQKAAG